MDTQAQMAMQENLVNGIDLEILTAPSYLDVHDISGDHRHIGLIYFAKSADGTPQLAEAEHHDIRWFTAEELAAPEWAVPEVIQFYATEALAKLAPTT